MITQKHIIASAPEGSQKLQLTAESKDGKAYVRIVGYISGWNKNNSEDFTKKVDELVNKYDECEVYINSQGGSVFEANEINNQLKRFKNVTVTVGALAASAATYFVANYPTTAHANSMFMIHKPMLLAEGNEDQIKNQLKLLEKVTQNYLKAYAKKTGKTEAEIEALWKAGDYWMSAQEAKSEKFIETVSDEDETITDSDVTTLKACGSPIVPKATATPKNPKTRNIMEREELIAFLGLDANATDEQIKEAQKQMKIDALKQREADEKAKTDQETEAATKAEQLVDKAIEDKKITADQKETYVELATANYDAAKKALDAMSKTPKLSSELNGGSGGEGATKPERKNWTLEDYLEQDPEAYETMKLKEPEKAEALEAAYFKKQS